jgi:hypothetical protein
VDERQKELISRFRNFRGVPQIDQEWIPILQEIRSCIESAVEETDVDTLLLFLSSPPRT